MTGKTIKEISADVRKCDFRGCTIFGKFQNSRAKLEYTDKNLPKDYVDRLIDFRVPDEAVMTTDIVYLDMIEGRVIRGTNGLNKVKQMVDYNLVDLKERIWKYRKVIRDYGIDISYTGAFLYQYGLDSIGKENYYINLEKRAKEAYLKGDMDYVESVFKELDKETKRNLVNLALKDGNEKFVRRHKKELRGVQKKYFENKDSRAKELEAREVIKENLLKEYREGKFIELEIDLMKSDIDVRTSIVNEIYKEGKLALVQKYLSVISPRLKNDILLAEYKKENIDFVYNNFKYIDNGDLKETIIRKELDNKNFKFLYENYSYIYNQNVRETIMKAAFREENVDFLNAHLEDMPKNMKLEAAVKFKNLKISKDELAQLLKK